jgi:predicted nucleic acid-binding protein
VIVVDSNVVAYLYLPGEHTAKAEALLEQDSDWAAPVLWRSEFRNILAGYLRRKTLTFDQACSLQSEAEDLLAGSEFEVDSKAVLELVRDSDCSAYDCEFIALANKLQVKLVTMDAKLLKAFPKRAISLTAGNVGVHPHVAARGAG